MEQIRTQQGIAAASPTTVSGTATTQFVAFDWTAAAGGACYHTVTLAAEQPPLLFWEFDEAYGRQADTSGGGNPLVDDPSPTNTSPGPEFPSQEFATATASAGGGSNVTNDNGLIPNMAGGTLIGWMYDGTTSGFVTFWGVEHVGHNGDLFQIPLMSIDYTFDHFDGQAYGNLTARLANIANDTQVEATQLITPNPGWNRFGVRWTADDLGDGTLDLIWDADIIASGTGNWNTGGSFDGAYGIQWSMSQNGDTGIVGIDEIHWHQQSVSDADLAAQWASRLVAC